MLSIPRRKAGQEDTTCASRAYMKMKAAELERTLDIVLQIVVNTYPEDIGAVHILADMWNDLRTLCSDDHRKLVQPVKEQL